MMVASGHLHVVPEQDGSLDDGGHLHVVPEQDGGLDDGGHLHVVPEQDGGFDDGGHLRVVGQLVQVAHHVVHTLHVVFASLHR